jgi:hypothetical protein
MEEPMAQAVRSLSAKQIAERTQQHRQAVIQLATYSARKATEAQLRALGKRPTTYSPAQLKALAQAELELNRISLMAEAEKTIATSPLFARWRLPSANLLTNAQSENVPKLTTSSVQILGAK